jgi:hypothetical protein
LINDTPSLSRFRMNGAFLSLPPISSWHTYSVKHAMLLVTRDLNPKVYDFCITIMNSQEFEHKCGFLVLYVC